MAHFDMDFKGCWCMDEMIEMKLNNGSYIINTLLTTSKDGEMGHWLALLITDDCIEYFDSYGEDMNKKLLAKLRTLNKPIYASTNKLQPYNTSVLCGYYCMFYIMNRCLNKKSMYDTIYSFNEMSNSNSIQNDRAVYKKILTLTKKFF